MRFAIPLLIVIIITVGCSDKESSLSSIPENFFEVGRDKLDFSCVHEFSSLPTLDKESNELFEYARYLEIKKGPKDYQAMARYYRIAASHGHYKANRNLQNIVAYGQARSPDAPKEVVDLAEQLIRQGVPGGYYDLGHYLETGYGVKRDPKLALRYFRKAADMGSPDAQAYVAKFLAPRDMAPDVARQMYACAMEQGFGEAAGVLGIKLKNSGDYEGAGQAFQRGVAAGDTSSTSFLMNGFWSSQREGEMYFLALPADEARSKRYGQILDFLIRYEHLNPKVPDIDQIVPLPPAKLPPWDGTFQWKREYDAAVPPPKPSEELVNRLSKAKNLDPATGLPLGVSLNDPTKANSDRDRKRTPLGSEVDSGQRCPESGVWCVRSGIGSLMAATHTFKAGEVMPELSGTLPRPFKWMDDLLGLRTYSMAATWELIEYAKKS